jgi:DNA-binding MarR family transcriptional regulator
MGEHSHRYAEVPIDVVRSSVTAQAKALYCLLASYVGPKGCYPTQTRLASELGVSVDSVARWTQELERAGFVLVETRKDSKGLRCGVRYILAATQAMYQARAARSVVDADSASMRSLADSASMRSPDSASMRSKYPQSYQPQELPLTPASGGTSVPVRAKTRGERRELLELEQLIARKCEHCGEVFTIRDVTILEAANGARFPGLVRYVQRRSRPGVGGMVSWEETTGGAHKACHDTQSQAAEFG